MIDQDSEKQDLKRDFDERYQYLKNETSIYRGLSSTFMVVSLTAFIFLISVAYPGLLDVYIIIGNIYIKVISFSLALLVFSFFSFLFSTLIYYYKSIKTNSLYLYWDSELSFSDRYEKLGKLADLQIAGFFLSMGIVTLGGAVVLMFLYFSAGGIIMAVIFFSVCGLLLMIFILFKKLKKYKKIFNRIILKKNQEWLLMKE